MERMVLGFHRATPVGAADGSRVLELEVHEPAVDWEHTVEQTKPHVRLDRWEHAEEPTGKSDVGGEGTRGGPRPR